MNEPRNKLYLDYETFSIEPALQAPPPVVMSYCWRRDGVLGPKKIAHARPGFSLPGDPCILDAIGPALLDDDTMLVGYHTTFEMLVTAANYECLRPLVWRKYDLGLVRCLYYMEKSIRIARGDAEEVTNLAASLQERQIPIVLNKSDYWRPRYGLLWDTKIADFPKEAIDYSLGDLAVIELEADQLEDSHPNEYVDHDDQVRAAFALGLTQCRGFMTNLETAKQLYAETLARIEEHKDKLLEAGLAQWKFEKGVAKVARIQGPAKQKMQEAFDRLGLPVPRNDPSPGQLKDIAKKYGLPAPKLRPKNPPSAQKLAAAAALLNAGVPADELIGEICLDSEACEESQDPLLEGYSEFGSATTLLSKVGRLVRAGEAGMPIQTSYNALVNTGRTSSRQGDDPDPGEPFMAYGMQIQNLPRAGEEEKE